jgi:formamidopyrimidine-DNA glycosylase
MPELPEVETIARILRPQLIGRTILSAEVRWARTVATPSVRHFKQQIQAQVIRQVDRRAKFLHLQLSSFDLLFHLRMSGDLSVREGRARPGKHDRLILVLSAPSPSLSSSLYRARSASPDAGVSLIFTDARKFGRVWLTRDVDEVTGKLGPEPFSAAFTPQVLYDGLHAHRRRLKPLLLDQTFLAGLGNIYTDEALHLARLHPLILANSITAEQAIRLHAAIRRILKEGIHRNGASIDWVYRGGDFQNHFRVYDRAGKPCPVCGTKIQRLVVGQRGTHICPKCQRE